MRKKMMELFSSNDAMWVMICEEKARRRRSKREKP